MGQVAGFVLKGSCLIGVLALIVINVYPYRIAGGFSYHVVGLYSEDGRPLESFSRGRVLGRKLANELSEMFSWDRTEFTGENLLAEVRIENHTGWAWTLTELEYRLVIDGDVFADGIWRDRDAIVLAKDRESRLYLPFSLKIPMEDVPDLLRDKPVSLLEGTAWYRMGAWQVGVPLSGVITLEMPR
ncbi:hypothetical protein SCOR_20685 [Sulfidibacter corallicola]|uniref:Uncharacterized protein n=1 Tax=Sulfidibacter corallicola TaxID=2818388 RepID=A0A8A4U330_SULCO|nr:hypothetical protein [Sulfidibacter corallicola]QTD53145.1 hypothetical protein J3U87_11845 [Sulfidibacter corallicola]